MGGDATLPTSGPIRALAAMRLPGLERAVVDVAKVRDSLLFHEHPVGRFKGGVL
jgi:hypothetical protein